MEGANDSGGGFYCIKGLRVGLTVHQAIGVSGIFQHIFIRGGELRSQNNTRRDDRSFQRSRKEEADVRSLCLFKCNQK
jgi:hypothetical protein